MSDCSDTPKKQQERKDKDPKQRQTGLGKGTTHGKKGPGTGGGQTKNDGK